MSINRPERPSVLLPWQALRHADLKKSNTAGWNEARLLLCFEEVLLPADFEPVSQWWMKRGRTGERLIDIDLRAVAKRDHLKLIGVLTRLLPPGRVSKNLLTYVSPEHNPSFTELWSESLMLAGRRSSATQLSPGDWLNDYRFEVVSILGAGGQGTAYEAIDHFPVQPGASRVVLKEFVLPVHGEFEAAASALALVQHEASIIRSLDAEFAVKFYDLFVEDCRAYLVREFVDGMSLKEMVENAGSLSLAQVCRLGVSMCEILDHLHTRVPPIIHRDFTPDNLLLSDNSNLKLIDFDIARFDDACRSNQVVGKPNYLSPEQFRGHATAQSDIYSLGATLFFLSTGRQPMPISASHPRSLCPSLCEQFDAIVARATDVDCGNRYASAVVLRQELINLLEENDATL
jgi:serine/threonine protein kinase